MTNEGAPPDARLLSGDCRELMRGAPEAAVEAIVTDPPYELGFMNMAWDRTGVALDPDTWRGALRVLKPGGHLVAFGGTRTFHRIACAIEDAGFEIRDCLSWLFGTGFPKSMDVSKAVDDALDAERPVVGQQKQRGAKFRLTQSIMGNGGFNDPSRSSYDRTAPTTAEAIRWSGWGTALKPGWEPIILARKPLTGTVANSALLYGTGGLNIESCRIACAEERHSSPRSGLMRWPPNVVLDEGTATLLDAESGTLGRSRFFYVPKASRAEREAGCECLPARTGAEAVNRSLSTKGLNSPRAGAGRTSPAIRNHHPTVKPLALMRWLVRLVTPPGGTVLEPFMGSGTTGCATALEGFGFVGMEVDREYLAIARARIAHFSRTA